MTETETAAIRIGDVEVVALTDGVADLETPIVEAFPVAPPDAVLADRSGHPGLYGRDGSWRLIVRAWLVRSRAGLLLVDTGVGPEASAAMSWFPEPGRLREALSSVGVAPADIETVVISHVHDDHVGGAVGGDGTPAFPNARYLLQRADLEALESWASTDDDDRVVFEQMVEPLRDAGRLDTLEGEHRLGPELTLHPAPGHTPGHQVLRVASGEDRLLISADTWNHPTQLRHPGWASATDADHDRASATRETLLAELRDQPDTICAPTHLDHPFWRILDGPDGLPSWEPVSP
jgi:glyoxylase-like metal-dependent hydrolase (beta-lactamase superfamily II)